MEFKNRSKQPEYWLPKLKKKERERPTLMNQAQKPPTLNRSQRRTW